MTCQLSELYWNNHALKIHGNDRSFPLHYLSIDGPHRESDSDNDQNTYSFQLIHDRTKEVVCSVRVSEDETDYYFALQKAIINAKLGTVI